MKPKNTYKIHVKCMNCGYKTSHPDEMTQIDKGIPIYRWAVYAECPKCGCTELCENKD